MWMGAKDLANSKNANPLLQKNVFGYMSTYVVNPYGYPKHVFSLCPCRIGVCTLHLYSAIVDSKASA